ncbi:hypothetical protein CRUP_010692, partial [Coryphaenoides rupestris]
SAALLSLCTLAVWTTGIAAVPADACRGPAAMGLHTELQGSPHTVMSAYREHRQAGVVRVLAIVDTTSHTAAAGRRQLANGGQRPDAYRALRPLGCNATQVMLSAHCGPPYSGTYTATACHNTDATVLTIHNAEQLEDFPVFLTVCMSTVSGNYSNSLQFLQTMELYRLWGVEKVVLYLSGPRVGGFFGQVLHRYAREGFLDVLPWRLPEGIRKNIHLNGQLSVMNECVYRSMYTSRYVLLADVNQLLVPYQHSSLRPLVEELQGRHRKPRCSGWRPTCSPRQGAAAHPKAHYLLEQVYREPMEEHDFRSYKMVVNPRLVTAMFEVLKYYGETVDVPSSMALIMQVKPHEESQEDSKGKHLLLDTRIREFEDLLKTKVNEIVKKATEAGDGSRY